MSGKHSSKGNRQLAKAKARRRVRALGLGGSAGAFLAFGLSPLAGAPTAKADVFDDILDVAVGSAASAAVCSVNPADIFDPGVLSGVLADLGSVNGWETLLGDLGSVSSAASSIPTDTGSAATDAGAAADSSTAFWQGLEQDWINSSLGQQVDSALNTWAAQVDPALAANTGAGGECGLICNGADGV
jgi:hypothetical protein